MKQINEDKTTSKGPSTVKKQTIKRAASYFYPTKSILAKDISTNGRKIDDYNDKDVSASMEKLFDSTMHVFKSRNDYHLKNMLFISKQSTNLISLAATLAGGSLNISGIKLTDDPIIEYSCAADNMNCFFTTILKIRELGDIEQGGKKVFYVDSEGVTLLSTWMKEHNYSGYKKSQKDYLVPLYTAALEVKYLHRNDCKSFTSAEKNNFF